MSKPPLDLTVHLRGPGGRPWRLSSDARDPRDRPVDISLATAAGEGHADGGVTVQRRYDGDYTDTDLLNEVTIEGVDGQTAYAGLVQGTPRSLNSSGSEVRLDLQGPMSGYAPLKPFTDLVIDQDLGAWGEAPLQTRKETVTAGASMEGPAVDTDDTGGPALRLTRPTSGAVVRSYAVYRAPAGSRISRLYYQYTSKAPAAAGCDIIICSADYGGSVGGQTTDLITTVDQAGSGSVTATAAYPFARLRFWNDPAPTVEQYVAFGRLAAIGDHGLPILDTADGPAIQLDSIMRHIWAQHAPRVDTSGIADNAYPVRQACWRELTTVPDAAKELNGYSQWALGIYNWELEWRPLDLSVYDWQVQAGIDGVEVETPGRTIEDAYNGAVVTWTDWSGTEQMLTPDDTVELADLNPAIAANQWGYPAWLPVPLSGQDTPDGAIQKARLALADQNRPKMPATITIPGHVRDGQGQWRQAWLPRANQTISIRNHPNDLPRLITSTSWQGNKLQITTDNALNRWEAIQTRMERRRAAGGMT